VARCPPGGDDQGISKTAFAVEGKEDNIFSEEIIKAVADEGIQWRTRCV
jgi:hypothetical protein